MSEKAELQRHLYTKFVKISCYYDHQTGKVVPNAELGVPTKGEFKSAKTFYRFSRPELSIVVLCYNFAFNEEWAKYVATSYADQPQDWFRVDLRD
jgi:hypothetical protein